MWTPGLRASPMIRTLKECDRYDPDNIEFTLSLLDRRFIAGDHALSQSLQTTTLPQVALREWSGIVHRLADLARARHQKYGNTIFHLEPNIKECPGGFRDHRELAHWLNLLPHQNVLEHKAWPTSFGNSLYSVHNDAAAAFEFLSATRCFLHLRSGRDDNSLDWHAQDEAAAQSIGLERKAPRTLPTGCGPTTGMRGRSIGAQSCDGSSPTGTAIFLPSATAQTGSHPRHLFRDPGRTHRCFGSRAVHGSGGILRVFALVAAHGYRLTQNAEDRLADALPVLDVHIPEGPFLWNGLREILLGPHAAHALRTMHALGILELLIPEFHGIDALVIRDSYHRYTVDEHTFLVIDNVHALRQPHLAWERRFSTLLSEIDRLDLFFLAVLMHDTGKARRTGDHTVQSVELADSLLARLELDAEERDQVRRLIRNHLEMSSTLRRDIFDSETIQRLCRKGGFAKPLEDAVPDDLCRYQGGQSRCLDPMEGG